MTTRGRSRSVLLLILGLIGLTVVCSPLPLKCSVGVSGTAAMFEISGIGAGDECATWLQSSEFYATNEQPTKPVICVVKVKQFTYTVRDQGVFNLVGTAVCTQLEGSR